MSEFDSACKVETVEKDKWKKIKVDEFNYKLIDENKNVVAENIMDCDIDLLFNAKTMESLLIEVLKTKRHGKVISYDLAEKISNVLRKIEGVKYEWK